MRAPQPSRCPDPLPQGTRERDRQERLDATVLKRTRALGKWYTPLAATFHRPWCVNYTIAYMPCAWAATVCKCLRACGPSYNTYRWVMYHEKGLDSCC